MSQSDLKPAKEMDLNELEAFLKSEQKPSVSGAMKALQDKIKRLESENRPLTSAQPLIEEFQRPSIQKLEEQVKFLEEQCRFARNETKRIQDQYDIDKENWALESEHFRRLLKTPANLNKHKPDKPQASHNKTSQKDLQNKLDTLNTENYSLKKNYENLKFSTDKKIHELESKLQKGRQKTSELMRLVEEKNKVIEELKNRLRRLESKKIVKNLSSVGRASKLSRSGSLKNSRNESIHLDEEEVKANGSFDKTFRKKVQDGVSEDIVNIERSILELGKKYKELISQSKNSSDITDLQAKINEITREMESKNEELYALKKKHQQTIREQIKSLETLRG